MNVLQICLLAFLISTPMISSAEDAKSEISNSSAKVKLENVSLKSVQFQLGASLSGVNAGAAGSDIEIGSLIACNVGVIKNVTTDVQMKNVSVFSTGKVRIGTVSSGC